MKSIYKKNKLNYKILILELNYYEISKKFREIRN